MYIGVYFCLIVPFWFAGAIILQRMDSRLILYTVLAILLPEFLFFLFHVFSAMARLMPTGTPGSWNYPGDYFPAGPVGWLIAMLPFIGLLSPLFLGWLMRGKPLPSASAYK